MSGNNQFITDKRILKLMDLLIEMKEVPSYVAFAEKAGFNNKIITSIRSGKQHFTVAQIISIIDAYKVNPSWIFGIEGEKLFRTLA